MANKLKPMDLGLKDGFVIHLIMASLPIGFNNFVISYNMSPEIWTFEKLIANCVQEEERIKANNGGSINYVKDNNKRKYKPSSSNAKGKQVMSQS